MKSIIRTVVALGAAAVLAPLTPAHADTPFSCNGSPEIPESYVCIVRFQVGVDPVVTHVDITVPAQTVVVPPTDVTVPSEPVDVPSEPVHVPPVCAGPFGFCTPAFDASTPPVHEDTPGTTQTVPGQTVPVPGVDEDVPFLGLSIPPGDVMVLWYNGTCYYLRNDGPPGQAPSTQPTGCP